jgi:tetratricopeptide (TPR) repeat protein
MNGSAGKLSSSGSSAWRALCVSALLLGLIADAVPAQAGVAGVRELRRAGRADEALQLAESALATQPEHEELIGLRGMLLLDAGRADEAAVLERRLSDYAGSHYRIHAFLGRQRLLAGETEGAIAASRRAVELKPDAVEPAVCLVQALLQARRARAAVRAAESLEAIAPDVGRKLGAQALHLQAQRMRQAGEESVPRAIPVLHAALEKSPGDRAILETLTETLIDTIKVEEARRLIDEHFSGAQDRALQHYLLGRALSVLTDVDGAETEFRAALDADPTHEGALFELTRIALDAEAWGDAEAWLGRVGGDSSGSGRLLVLRGMVEDGQGRPDAARRAYEQALELAPENAKARYLLGRLLVRSGEEAEGLELLAAQVDAEGH